MTVLAVLLLITLGFVGATLLIAGPAWGEPRGRGRGARASTRLAVAVVMLGSAIALFIILALRWMGTVLGNILSSPS